MTDADVPVAAKSPLTSAIAFGLIGIVWFGAFFQAAHDLWAASVIFLASTVLLTLFAVHHYRSPQPLRLPLFVPLALMLAAAWASSIHSVDINTTRQDAWGWTFAVVLFYIALNIFRTDEQWKTFLLRCGGVIVPLTAICLWQRLTPHPPDNLVVWGIPVWQNWKGHPDSWGRWEIMATLINSVVLSGFVLNWIVLFYEDTLRQKKQAMVLLACSLIVLFLTRSFWAGFCLVAALSIYHRRALWNIVQKHKSAAVLLALIALCVLGALIFKKVHALDGPYKGSSRFYYWGAAFEMWRARPWLGVGLGSYAVSYPYFKSLQFQSTLFAHSFPLQWLCETGAAGVSALLILLIRAGKELRKNTPYAITIAVVLLFSLLSINMDFLLLKLTLLLFLAAALPRTTISSYRVKPLWIGVLTLSIWLLSVFWLRIWVGTQITREGQQLEVTGDTVQAAKRYEDAININPANADAFASLAGIYKRAYEKNHSEQNLQAWRYCLSQALRCRNDVRYRLELASMPGPKS